MQKNPNQYDRPPGKKCVENDGPVGTVLQAVIKEDCEALKVLVGELTEVEQNRRGLKRIYESKKCVFIETETNYQVYRNLELGLGVELVQATTEIKQDVTTNIGLNDQLAATLKSLVVALRDAKQKFNELRKAACDLEACKKDKCSCTQMTILTGKPQEKCDDKTPTPKRAACEDTEKILHWLIHKPELFLHDIDMSLSAAADVAGIQTFMNIKSLETFQQNMTTSTTGFDSFVQEKMNKGAEDLKTCQAELTTMIKDLTKADYVVYRKRNQAEGSKETIEYLCCHKCECLRECDDRSDDKDQKERLKQCKEWICHICEKVDDIYCDFPDHGRDSGPEQGYDHDHDHHHEAH